MTVESILESSLTINIFLSVGSEGNNSSQIHFWHHLEGWVMPVPILY